MASMPFSATLSTPLLGLAEAKANPDSSARPYMASPIKSSFGYAQARTSGPILKYPSLRVYARAATEKSVHDFTVKDIEGKDVSLSKFKGKALLIVNVASKCGLTTSNYSELSHLYEKYKTQGFEILAFPCNQFGGQFACTKFKAEFPIFTSF